MKYIFYVLSFLAFVTAIQSCDKRIDHSSKQIVIDTTLAPDAEYVLNLKPYGDADDVATIIKQAGSFSTSEIINSTTEFDPVYHFSYNTKALQSQQVVIAVTEGNHGNASYHHNTDSTLITINFIIK